MMRISEKVSDIRMSGGLNAGLKVALSVYTRYGWDMTVTALSDQLGGNEASLSTENIPKNLVGQIRGEIAGALTSEFIVTREDPFIHIEYQRKS